MQSNAFIALLRANRNENLIDKQVIAMFAIFTISFSVITQMIKTCSNVSLMCVTLISLLLSWSTKKNTKWLDSLKQNDTDDKIHS